MHRNVAAARLYWFGLWQVLSCAKMLSSESTRPEGGGRKFLSSWRRFEPRSGRGLQERTRGRSTREKPDNQVELSLIYSIDGGFGLWSHCGAGAGRRTLGINPPPWVRLISLSSPTTPHAPLPEQRDSQCASAVSASPVRGPMGGVPGAFEIQPPLRNPHRRPPAWRTDVSKCGIHPRRWPRPRDH